MLYQHFECKDVTLALHQKYTQRFFLSLSLPKCVKCAEGFIHDLLSFWVGGGNTHKWIDTNGCVRVCVCACRRHYHNDMWNAVIWLGSAVSVWRWECWNSGYSNCGDIPKLQLQRKPHWLRLKHCGNKKHVAFVGFLVVRNKLSHVMWLICHGNTASAKPKDRDSEREDY